MTRFSALFAWMCLAAVSDPLPAQVVKKTVETKKAEAKAEVVELVIPGQILGVDPPDKVRNLPCKIHVVKLQKDRSYLIDMVSSEFDSYLRLEDTAGNQLAQDDDGGGNLNSRIRYTAKKDDVFLVIATSCGGGGGNYTLSVRSFVPAPVKLIALDAPTANKASEFQGPLNAQDPVDHSRNVPCRVHTIELKEGKNYVIDLLCKDFDPYLRLESPDGNNLGEDDDSGGMLQSRITHQARTTGRYRIVAMPLSGGPNGQYTLRVREQ